MLLSAIVKIFDIETGFHFKKVESECLNIYILFSKFSPQVLIHLKVQNSKFHKAKIHF